MAGVLRGGRRVDAAAQPSRLETDDRLVAEARSVAGILSEAIPDPPRRVAPTGDLNEMTMSETPRDPIPMTGPAPSDGLLVSVTEAAAKKVLELREREGKADAKLRLFVKSGGCSGFSYGLAFDDRINEGDRLEDHAGVPIVIDQFSQQYVDGAEIDYVDSLMGSVRHQQPERGQQLRLRLLVQHRRLTGQGRRLRPLAFTSSRLKPRPRAGASSCPRLARALTCSRE